MQLHERFRPRTWADFVSQDKAVARLRAIIGLPTFDRGAFLLTGTSGSGKTSMAHVAANTLCGDPFYAIREIRGQDCAVDTLRDVDSWFQLHPPDGGFKALIVNEAHLMTNAARAFALEMMECPPTRRVIFLTTTETDWADETLFSRFYSIRLEKPRADAIVEYLQRVARSEGFNLPAMNWKRFVQDRHNNLRLALNDLEIEAAIAAAEADSAASAAA